MGVLSYEESYGVNIQIEVRDEYGKTYQVTKWKIIPLFPDTYRDGQRVIVTIKDEGQIHETIKKQYGIT